MKALFYKLFDIIKENNQSILGFIFAILLSTGVFCALYYGNKHHVKNGMCLQEEPFDEIYKIVEKGSKEVIVVVVKDNYIKTAPIGKLKRIYYKNYNVVRCPK